MHALPEGVGVQLQSMRVCPSYQVSVVIVVPRRRSRCTCNTIAKVSEHDIKAIGSLFVVAIL